jgi:hypothetical protein
MISFLERLNSETKNNIFNTALYSIMEYQTPSRRINTEIGLRTDHYYLTDNNTSLSSKPVFNPRFNVDFNLFKNMGIIESFNLVAGTGLFSSTNILTFDLAKIDDYKPARSFTSVLGARLEFVHDINLNIEGYYKYLFDRVYTPDADNHPQFDGEGRAWGMDLLLQKMQSRYFDGWIAYSFNFTKHLDPASGDSWFFPEYHRFHNLNIVFNVKPS